MVINPAENKIIAKSDIRTGMSDMMFIFADAKIMIFDLDE